MSIKLNNKVTPFTGLHVKSTNKHKDAIVYFDLADTAPTDTSDYYFLYVDPTTKNLMFSSDGTPVTLGAAGSTVNTWEGMFANDKTLAMSTTTFTLTQSSDVALFTLSKTGTGAGAVIDISNSGTGADIIGEGDTWQISKAGLAQFATNSVIGGIIKVGGGSAAGEVTSNGAYNLVISTNSGTNSSEIEIVDAANGDVDITLNGTGAVNINGTTTHNDALVVAAGDVAITTGSLILADDQNAISLGVTNNTATTIGNASSTGVMNIVSTSMTTGALVNAELTEGTLAGGWYYRAWDATGAGAVWSIGENGLTTIGGADGANAFVITAGDAVLSNGSLAVTDTDNAASFTVTNNTATTASAVVLAGSGVFTGSTTSSFMTITPSGLTTGTALYFPLAGLTEGKGLQMIANALTSGSVLSVASSATAMTANGRLLSVVHSGNASTSGVLSEFSSAAADETVVLQVKASAALALGTLLNLSAAALTTGKGIALADMAAFTTGTALHIDSTGTTQTTGKLIHIDSAATAIATTGRMFLSDHTGATTTSGILNELKTAANDETKLLQLTADSLTSGTCIDIDLAALTTGVGIDISNLAAFTEGKVLHIDSTGTTQTTGQLLYLDSAATAIATTGRLFLSDHTGATTTSGTLNEFKTAAADETVLLLLDGDSLTSGNLLDINAAALDSGVGIDMSSLAAFTTGKGIHIDASGTTQTSGILVHIDSAGTAMTGAGRLLRVDHTGATTTAGICSEFASAATDETQIVQITASAALALGKCLDISAVAMTTGTALDIGDLDALTTGKAIDVVSNSADATSRTLVNIHNDHASATGVTPLTIVQDAPTSTNFKKCATFAGYTVWISDGTTAEGALTGAEGDVCLNGGTGAGQMAFCDAAGTNWTDM